MDKQIVIPEGWTYFSHRTNTERWQTNPFVAETIIVEKLMSVVTEDEIYQEVRHYGKDHWQGYSSGGGMPFEIRCLICSLPYLQVISDDFDIKKIMIKEFYYDRNNFGGAYGQRHHSIPKGEELSILGFSSYDEVYERDKKIIWNIPKLFIDFYRCDIQKNNNRFISLISSEYDSSKKM